LAVVACPHVIKILQSVLELAALLTGGSALGTVGGAAVGGVIGNQIGK